MTLFENTIFVDVISLVSWDEIMFKVGYKSNDYYLYKKRRHKMLRGECHVKMEQRLESCTYKPKIADNH